MMDLSIICPTYNEIHFITQVVKDLCADDGLNKEILIVDGGSTDGTVEQVTILQQQYSNVVFVPNPRKTSTAAFNIGCDVAKGEFIAFVGAHARYSADYFSVGVAELRSGACDAVGGTLNQEGKTEKAKAIALVMSSKAGVGNTEFRTSKEKMYVDSVAFALYRKEMVLKVGKMDESLPVNQDDEFHYRLNERGYKILMTPEMSATYFVRDNYGKLFKQYYKYGFYKPMVLKKVKGAVRVRHLIPSAFVVYLLSLPMAFLYPIWMFPLLCYILLITFFSFHTKEALRVKWYAIPVFPVLHLSYGGGFILGLMNK